MTECTQESGHRHSMYSLVCGSNNNLYRHEFHTYMVDIHEEVKTYVWGDTRDTLCDQCGINDGNPFKADMKVQETVQLAHIWMDIHHVHDLHTNIQ